MFSEMTPDELFAKVAAPHSRRISASEVAAHLDAGVRVYGFTGAEILRVRSQESADSFMFVWVGVNEVPITQK